MNCQPQHVHLSFGEAPDQIAVLWATNGTCSTEVLYGTSPWKLDQKVTGTSNTFTEHNRNGLHVLHKALLTVRHCAWLNKTGNTSVVCAYVFNLLLCLQT